MRSDRTARRTVARPRPTAHRSDAHASDTHRLDRRRSAPERAGTTRRAHRRDRPAAGPVVSPSRRPRARSFAATVLAVAAFALLGAAWAAPTAELVPTDELRRVVAGTCNTCKDESSSEPSKVGSSYWVETWRTLNATDVEPAQLVAMISNRSSSVLEHQVRLTEREVRRVDFSGGWANYFSASIGGEIDRSTERTYTMHVAPWHRGKVYTQQRTQRFTVYGTRYQDYSDGSRKVVETDNGPYRHGFTHVSYVEYAL